MFKNLDEQDRYRLFLWLFFAGVIGLAVIQQSCGMNYVYNMTSRERQEYNLMALCYSTDIKIDAMAFNNQSLTRWCSERYGGIDTIYGEAIK